jgi:hypothetical protein
LNITTARDSSKTLKVDIRDMTSPGFTRRPVEVVQILDDLDRDFGSKYIWFNEFAQKKTSIQYNNFGCSVFKLPGNIYDPSGYSTDKDGNPTSNQGVWLASYQFNVYIEKLFGQRTTGAAYYTTTEGSFIRSHYHLNYTEGNLLDGSVESAGSQVGVFPYEKPWSANYPAPYSIPKKPTQQRVLWGGDRLLRPGSTPSNPVYYIEEPAYSDGDLVGNPVGGSIGEVGGFGVQYFGTSWFYNRIANVATKTYMYKYESGVAQNETYANGYEPYWDASNNPYPYNDFPFAGISKVENGEKYQRLECGYGYFIKPQGWSRIVRESWAGDVPKDLGFLNGFGTSENPGPSIVQSGTIAGWYYRKPYPLTAYNINNQNLSLNLGGPSPIKEGVLDFYRIVDSGPDENGEFTNISSTESYIIPTEVKLKIEGAFQCWSIQIKNRGVIPVEMRNPFRGTIRVFKQSGGAISNFTFDSSDIYVGPGQPFTLQPGDSFITQDAPASVSIYSQYRPSQDYFYDDTSNFRRIDHSIFPYPVWVRDNVSFTTITLPGNTGIADNQNIFLNARYDIIVNYYQSAALYARTIKPTTNLLGPLLQLDFVSSIVFGGQLTNRRYAALYSSRSFPSRDFRYMEAYSTNDENGLVNGTEPITKTFSFNGASNISGNNTYFIRTSTNGSNNGLLHEGIGKHFYYGGQEYYDQADKTLYAMRVEGPTTTLWNQLNDASNDGTAYGMGRYLP